MGYYGEPSEPIYLGIEEFECIRLLDYEHLSQEQAATYMEVSRPTLTRIYERARHKIATAFTESHQLIIEGGRAIFNGEWYQCDTCSSKFNNPLHIKVHACPLCSSQQIQKLEV